MVAPWIQHIHDSQHTYAPDRLIQSAKLETFNPDVAEGCTVVQGCWVLWTRQTFRSFQLHICMFCYVSSSWRCARTHTQINTHEQSYTPLFIFWQTCSLTRGDPDRVFTFIVRTRKSTPIRAQKTGRHVSEKHLRERGGDRTIEIGRDREIGR